MESFFVFLIFCTKKLKLLRCREHLIIVKKRTSGGCEVNMRVDKYSIYLKQLYELVRLKDIRK